jgi:hypothetical protein
MVQSSNQVAAAVVEFQGRLGIERDREAVDARRWLDAASDVRSRTFETGADGVEVARRLGSATLGRAKSATGKVSGGIVERSNRLRRQDDDESEQS